MEKERRFTDKTVVFGLCSLMVFTLTFTMGRALGLALQLPGMLTASLVMCVLMMALLLYPLLWVLFGGLLFVGGLLINHFLPVYRIVIYEWISGFILNLILYVQGKEVILPGNILAVWLLLVAGISLLTGNQALRRKSTWPLLVIYGSLFLVYWYRHVDIAYSMMMLFLVAYLVLFSLRKYQLTQECWRTEKAQVQDNLYTPWQKTAVVYGLIIVLGAAVMPKTEAFVEWGWMETRLMKRFPILTDLRGSLEHSRSFGASDYFTLSATGFQEDPRVLGGPVQLSDRLVMTVESPAPFYLRGNVKSFYRDNAWGYHQAKAINQPIHEALIPEAPGVTQGEEVELSITFHNFSSATIFAPYQPIQIESLRYDEVTVDNNFQLSFLGGVFKNESYRVWARIPTSDQGNGIDPPGMLPADYLQLPDTISTNLAQLTTSITHGLENPLEKALALQQYLRQNHAYSLEVPHTPDEMEFVDYFIFDLKEGYCTYYATALAVMLRLEGIPSRYVEGYLMPRDRHEGLYEVRQENAHAWVEAYFQGTGWVTLEPTPAYPLPEQQQLSGMTAGDPGTLMGDVDAFLTMLEGLEVDEGAVQGPENPDPAPSIPEDEQGQVDDNTTAWVQGINRLLMGSIILLFFGVTLRIIWVNHCLRRYRQQLEGLSPRSQVLHLYGNILELLALLGFPVKGGETPYEFSYRIGKQLYDMEHRFDKLTDYYVLAQYSQEEIPLEVPAALLEYLDYVDSRNRHQQGIGRYFWVKYLRNATCSTCINQAWSGEQKFKETVRK